MLCIKVPIKEAEKVKKEIVNQGLLDKEHHILREKGFVYFPIKKRFKTSHKLVNKLLKSRILQTDLKNSLIKKLSKEELEVLRKSMDVVGNIAILEIPDELIKKEKLIAQEVLRINKNIKTVLRKGKHKGVFRVQKLDYLAGEKTKETIYKENNVIMKLDVEQVYFSPRLASERKRVMQLIKKPEDVMVLFSGCAPYVCVIAKNTPAKYVYGIEINPVAHKYGWENIKLNKINNAFLINEDAKTALPNFYQRILGLKSAIKPEEMKSRLKHNPLIMEVHTFESYFYEGFDNLKKTIKTLQEDGKYVIVHQPIKKQDIELNLNNYDAKNEIYQKMISLVKEYGVKLIIHPLTYKKEGTPEKLIENMKTFSKHYDNIFFENYPHGLFSSKEEIICMIKAAGIKNMCIDLCHLLYKHPAKEIPGVIEEIQRHCNTYFHINDYKDEVHGSVINESTVIPVKEILPLVTIGITEIISKDEIEGAEMISSWKYIGRLQRAFDRIIMPLPKSAADFLDVALAASKKGTMIHFYDFQKEGEFEKSAEKIKKACKEAGKKCRILGVVKCGQSAPREFRICVDFEVL